MGCDIHCRAEKRDTSGQWVAVGVREPFDWRQYGLFAWLANVRNYSDVPPLAEPKGVPGDASRSTLEDISSWDGDGHSHSWHDLATLMAFDYEQLVEDRRITVQTGPNSWNGGATSAPGGGKTMTYREFLGPKYFEELERLKAEGVDRIVFWFDN